MLVQNYGLFWKRENVDWNGKPGKGNSFQVLGHLRRKKQKDGKTADFRQRKKQKDGKTADFRQQIGIYLLYGNQGLYYVGQTQRGIKRALGERLKDHTTDKHKHEWDRFCWFGFKPVLKTRVQATGLNKLKQGVPQKKSVVPSEQISDLEALLILVTANRNVRKMNFAMAERYTQGAPRRPGK